MINTELDMEYLETHLEREKKAVLIQIIKDTCRENANKTTVLRFNLDLVSEAFDLACKELADKKSQTVDDIKRPLLNRAISIISNKKEKKI